VQDLGNALTDLSQGFYAYILEWVVRVFCDGYKSSHDRFRQWYFRSTLIAATTAPLRSNLNNGTNELDRLLFLNCMLIVLCERPGRS